MKIDVQIDSCWVSRNQIGFGVTQFSCFSPVAPQPVGVVWAMCSGPGDAGKSHCEVCESYVLSWARRQGVRSLINEKIFTDYGSDVILTILGSVDGGKAFMLNAGYRLDQSTGLWVLTKRKWKQVAKKRQTEKA